MCKKVRLINDKNSQCGLHDSLYWIVSKQSDGTTWARCTECLKAPPPAQSQEEKK